MINQKPEFLTLLRRVIFAVIFAFALAGAAHASGETQMFEFISVLKHNSDPIVEYRAVTTISLRGNPDPDAIDIYVRNVRKSTWTKIREIRNVRVCKIFHTVATPLSAELPEGLKVDHVKNPAPKTAFLSYRAVGHAESTTTYLALQDVMRELKAANSWVIDDREPPADVLKHEAPEIAKTKSYEYLAKIEFGEEVIEYCIRYILTLDDPKIGDQVVTSIRKAGMAEWLPLKTYPSVDLIAFHFTTDLNPSISFPSRARSPVKIQSVGVPWVKGASNDSSSVFSFHGHGTSSGPPLHVSLWQERIAISDRHPGLLGMADSELDELSTFGASRTATPSDPKPVPAVASSPSSDEIREGEWLYVLSDETDSLRLTRNDGKFVSFPGTKKASAAKLTMANGILTVEGSARLIDLRMFDAEVSFIGDTLKLETVKGSEIVLNAQTVFDTNYPDLVKRERAIIDRGARIELEEEVTPDLRRIQSTLKGFRSVKLLGKPGTGKTAKADQLARLIALGKMAGIPRTAELRLVSLNMLKSGTKFQGELAGKVQVLLEYAEKSKPVLLIDEAHRLVTIGVNMNSDISITEDLNPALESGKMRAIALSTPQQWGNAYATVPAFDQRFTLVAAEEPSGEALLKILRNFFRQRGLSTPADEVLTEAVKISDRFAITGAQPRKAVNLLLDGFQYLEESGHEGRPLDREALRRAAIAKYDISPIYFDRAKIYAKITKMRAELAEQFEGQDDAIDKISDMNFKKLTGVGDEEVANTIIFYGPPGTGKTSIANASAEIAEYKKYLVEMNKYANGDVEAFRYEVYRALLLSPNTLVVFDETEKAARSVQDAALSMLQPGSFTVNFRTPDGQFIFEEVNSRNMMGVFTTNAGAKIVGSPRASAKKVGFKTSREMVLPDAPSLEAVRRALSEENISAPLLSRILSVVGMPRPNEAKFRVALNKKIQRTLKRESDRTGVTFRLSNQKALVEHLMQGFVPDVTDYRDLNKMMQTSVEPLISQAMILPNFETSHRVQIVWSKKLTAMKFPTLQDCRFLIYEADHPPLAASPPTR